MNRLYKLQSLVLLTGTLFAWSTVYSDFSRFYKLYGTLIRVQNCTIPNPILTPCFYGAFAFLFGFIWSLIILRKTQKEKLPQQRKLNILLLAGTIFAWTNFAYEAVKFYLVKTGSKLSCSGVPTQNILLTPCFYGSVLFALSLIISLAIMKKPKN